MTGSGTRQKRITDRAIAVMGKNATIWDVEVPGFCARRELTHEIRFYMRVRGNGRGNLVCIGIYGPDLSIDDARKRASAIVADKAASQRSMAQPEV